MGQIIKSLACLRLSVCLSVCECDTLHATAVLTNRLGSSVPLGSEYVSLETWDDGAQRLLTLKTSQRRLGGQPWPPRTPRSSRSARRSCSHAVTPYSTPLHHVQ